MKTADAQLQQAIDEAWPRAQARWSRFLLLRPPIDDAGQDTVAQINLATRQVALHHRLIRGKDLLGSVEAILAHEIGHHVRYPGTLVTQARLRLLEKSLLPLKDYSLINLFEDLLINETLGHDLQDQLAAVYQAFTADGDWRADPAFVFYLAVYEELWQMEPGMLMGPGRPEFEQAYPAYRADAQVLAQDLFHLGPNVFTQFLYFVSVVSRYVRPHKGELPIAADPYSCGCGEPTPEDWADALTPSARERAAIERALAEGWLRQEQAEHMLDAAALERRILGLPGSDTADASLVPDVMAAFYRQEAERYLLRPPPQRLVGEAVVPTTLEEWQPGDSPRDIDWLTTLVQRGPIYGAVEPLQRTRIAEVEGFDVPLWQPRVEIYLDVSGSMPDPRRTRNAMTLAAHILNVGAIRAGGWVRALLYSTGHVAYWQWARSEVELSRFLMHYIGAGTAFPFDVLHKSVAECGAVQPIRLVITDPDFDMNYKAKSANARIFADAVAASPHFVLLLHAPRPERVAHYRKVGARVVPVPQMDNFPRMAADLSRALFAEDRHVTR